MKKRYIALILIAFGLVIFLPPVIHGYVYPVLGQDTATHEIVFDKIKIGSPIPFGTGTNVRYLSYYILGYPLDLVSRVTHLSEDVLFFWFNYAALFGVGVSLFYIFNKLFGIYIGLLALVIPLFTSHAILMLFYSGIVFNVINMAIILPFIVYFIIRILQTGKRGYWFGAGLLSVLFTLTHSSGIYLPFFAAVGFLAFLIYKRKIRKSYIIAGVIILAVSALFLIYNADMITRQMKLNLMQNDGEYGSALLWRSLTYYMSEILLVMLVLAVVMLVLNWRKVNQQDKLTLAVFSIMPIALLPAVLLGLSPQPFRQGLDLAILLSLLMLVMVGATLKIVKVREILYGVVFLVALGSILNVGNWLTKYNSAIEKVDTEAINYVNSLPVAYYSASHNVDTVIYSRFIHSEYIPTGGEVVIMRNVAMKSSGVLPEKDIVIPSGMAVLKEFSDGKTSVEVYGYRR